MSNTHFANIAELGEEKPVEKGTYLLKLLDVITEGDDGQPLMTTKEPPREMRFLSFAFVEEEAPPFRHLVMVPGDNTPAEQVNRQLRDMKRIVAFFGEDPNDPDSYEPDVWKGWKGWEGELYVAKQKDNRDESGETFQNSARFPAFE